MSEALPAGQHTIRRHNATLVLDAISAQPGISRADVAASIGLAKATVSTTIELLKAEGLVVDVGPQERVGRGRRGIGLALSPHGPHGLGVEIGVDYLASCLVDLTGRPYGHQVWPGDNREQSRDEVLARVAELIVAALEETEQREVPVGGVGIAVPGLVESATFLRNAPNLGWRDIDLGATLREHLDKPELPVHVGNEADLAALAELVNTTERDFVRISGEIGIGAGIIIDGEPFHGVRGFAGEIGHVNVDPRGTRCNCGALGCLETLAGQDAILRRAGITSDGLPPDELVRALTAQLTSGDPVARAAVESAGQALGIALAGLINLMDIPTAILGGSYAALEPWLAPPLHAQLAERVVSFGWAPPNVLRSTLGREAAVQGGASLAIKTLLANPLGQ